MGNKNLFNVFLISVLVLVGVFFVVGVTPLSLSTPSANLDVPIYGNYTMTFTIDNTNFSNVVNMTIYNATVTWSDPTDEPVASSTALDWNNTLIINLSNSSSNVNSFSVVLDTGNFTNGIWGRGDGNYTLTALMTNLSNFKEYINISFLIDNTPPSALILIAPNLSETFINDATIQFGFAVNDSMSGNSTYGNRINCSLYIDEVLINSNLVVSNATDYWVNVTSTSFVENNGIHTWNITCRDKANNLNNSASWTDTCGNQRNYGTFNLTDTSGPTTNTPTFSASSVVKDAAITITCTGTDTISANPIEYISVKGPNADWQGDIGISPYSFTGTNTAGTWAVRCRSIDAAGNTGGFGSEATFTVTTASSNSGGTSSTSGTSSSTPAKVVAYAGQTQNLGSLTTSAGGEGIINAYQSSIVTFSVVASSGSDSGSHSIEFDQVSYIDGSVTVVISSNPVTLTLNVGDVEMVDLDGDGVNDLQVTLNSVDSNGKVDMTIKDLGASALTGDATVATSETGAKEIVPGSRGGLGAIWWILIIVVVIVIIVLVLPKKKRK
jgi:hypothetical protein